MLQYNFMANPARGASPRAAKVNRQNVQRFSFQIVKVAQSQFRQIAQSKMHKIHGRILCIFF